MKSIIKKKPQQQFVAGIVYNFKYAKLFSSFPSNCCFYCYYYYRRRFVVTIFVHCNVRAYTLLLLRIYL